MRTPTGRIWGHAALAWLALVALPTSIVVVRWQMGLDRDPDMQGVGDLIFTFLLFLSVPMAGMAFGVLAPTAIVIDRWVRGRTSRFINLLLGATLAVPAVVVTLLVGTLMGWGGIAAVGVRASIENAIRHPTPLLSMLGHFAVAGMIVGLGLRTRRDVEAL